MEPDDYRRRPAHSLPATPEQQEQYNRQGYPDPEQAYLDQYPDQWEDFYGKIFYSIGHRERMLMIRALQTGKRIKYFSPRPFALDHPGIPRLVDPAAYHQPDDLDPSTE